MPPPNNPIKSQLDKLAKKIAEDALSTQSSIERLDAFKLLTNYYIGTTKMDTKKKSEGDEDGGENFDGFRKSVETGGRAGRS